MISLKVLGSVTLETESGQAIQEVLAQPKRLALLVFLAANPQRGFIGREELFNSFWPELGTERARAALSQALYFLRKKLGEDTIQVRGKDEVGINRDRIRCDTDDFAEARQAGDHHRMLELYRGDLLQGVFLLDSAEWEDWLESERRRLRNQAAEAAWSLSEAAREAGEDERATRMGMRALALSAYQEPLFQRMLLLLDDLGDRAGVARLFREYAERLRREYDIDVAPESRALYDQIMSRSPRPSRPRVASAPVAASASGGAAGALGGSRKIASASLAQASTWMAAAATLTLLLVAGLSTGWFGFGARSAATSTSAAADPERLVQLTILPFVDSDADAGMNYVAPGIREELYHRLSRLHRLRVLTPPAAPLSNDAGPAGGQTVPGAKGDFQLSGRVDSNATGLRVELSLTEAGGGESGPLGAASFDLGDMLAASASAAEWVADRLLQDLTTEDARRLRSGVTTDNEAFALYLRGRYQLTAANAEGFERARELFESSLALDPAYARAWSGLADAFMGLSWSRGLPDVVAVPRAREAAERSLELNPALAEGHASLAHILNRYYWDSEGAERHFHEAIRLQPDSADAHLRYSAFLRNLGRFEQARSEAERAVTLNPLNLATHREMVILDMMEGYTDAAVRRSRQLVELHPDVPMAQFFLARSLIAAGDFEGALEVLERMPVNRNRPPALTLRGYLMGRTGRADEAKRVIQALRSSAEQAPDMSVNFDLAVVYLGLGDYEQTLEALELAADQRDHRVRLLGEEPMFQVLRGQPKFTALLELAGLPVEPGRDGADRF